MKDLYGPENIYTAPGPYEPDPSTLNPAAWSTRDPGPPKHKRHRDPMADIKAARRRTERLIREWEQNPPPPWKPLNRSAISYPDEQDRLDLPDSEWPLSTDLPREALAAIAWEPPWWTWEGIEQVKHLTGGRPSTSKAKSPARFRRTVDRNAPGTGAQ